jgi:anhydro-N-acetylmuramic acid kinase
MITEYYMGLMSGTSVDSIDGALISFNQAGTITIHATHSITIPKNIRENLLQISTNPNISLEQLGLLDNTLGNLFADCALHIINSANIPNHQIKAIGSHGQNIYHNPKINYTLQIGNPNIISKKTGIPTIADFRRGDMAMGGQGAPLAPLFHHALFYSPEKNRVILNLGGIANITVLKPGLSYPLQGFDTGPANSLLDALSQKYFNQPYDKNGEISATGKIQEKLLSKLLQDNYFSKKSPKSTGKEYFNLTWIESYLDQEYLPQDLLATLTELTAKTIAEAIHLISTQLNAQFKSELFCCGGGVYNPYLLSRIQENLGHDIPVYNTEVLGLDPKWVEAALFAWLAKMRIEEKSLDLKSTTGSNRPVVLGAIYRP